MDSNPRDFTILTQKQDDYLKRLRQVQDSIETAKQVQEDREEHEKWNLESNAKSMMTRLGIYNFDEPEGISDTGKCSL